MILPIPAIDILGGQVVRLTRGSYDEVTVYSDDPVELAGRWCSEGAGMLHVVDLDGARAGSPGNADSIQAIASSSPVPVQAGGGIRDIGSVGLLLESGVERVVIGTAAVTDPDFLDETIEAFGPERLVVALDTRLGKVSLSGWLEDSDVTAAELAGQLDARGVEHFLVTAIEVDGTMEGPDLGLLELVSSRTSSPVIASGGIGSLDDLRDLVSLGDGVAGGVILGRALYEGVFTLPEATEVLLGEDRQ